MLPTSAVIEGEEMCVCLEAAKKVPFVSILLQMHLHLILILVMINIVLSFFSFLFSMHCTFLNTVFERGKPRRQATSSNTFQRTVVFSFH